MSGKAFFFLVLAALALGVLAGGAMIAVLGARPRNMVGGRFGV